MNDKPERDPGEEAAKKVGLPAWASPHTFFRADHTQDLEGSDIVFFGNSWDFTGYWENGGTRFGPKVIREYSCALDAFQSFADYPFYPFHFNVLKIAKLIDYGDLQYGVMPYMHERWQEVTVDTVLKILDAGASPLMCGGEHTIAAPMVRALGQRYENMACIHFDAHHDFFECGDMPHSGAPMMIGVDEEVFDPRHVIGVGYRGAFNYDRPDDFEVLWGHDVVRMGPTAVAEKIREVVGDRPCYLTFDLDVFSSETIDGTSTLVPGGPDFHMIQGILYNLQGLNIVAADLSELNGSTAGKSTCTVSAYVMVMLAHLLAVARGHIEPNLQFDFG